MATARVEMNGISEEAEIMVGGVTALTAQERAQVDIQIATAKQYPRDIKRAMEEARTLALFDEETAAEMFYAMPRDGKVVEGPSVRLAEIILYAWGNARVDIDVEAIEDRTLTAVATTFDLEKNTAVRARVRRRITNKSGRRYSDDMITTTGNAGMSIAFRNSIFKVIPKAYWKPIYEAARVKAVGSADSIAGRFKKASEWFHKLAVTDDRILAALGRESVADITMDDLVTLTGFRTAIKEQQITIEEAFPVPGQKPVSEGAADATERLRNAAAKKAAPKEHATPAPAPEQAAEDPELRLARSAYDVAVREVMPAWQQNDSARMSWEAGVIGEDRVADGGYTAAEYRVLVEKLRARDGLEPEETAAGHDELPL